MATCPRLDVAPPFGSSMERLVELGRVRALGVSNFGVEDPA